MLNILKNSPKTTVTADLKANEAIAFLKEVRAENPALFLNGGGIAVGEMAVLKLKHDESVTVAVTVRGGQYACIEINGQNGGEPLLFLPF